MPFRKTNNIKLPLNRQHVYTTNSRLYVLFFFLKGRLPIIKYKATLPLPFRNDKKATAKEMGERAGTRVKKTTRVQLVDSDKANEVYKKWEGG